MVLDVSYNQSKNYEFHNKNIVTLHYTFVYFSFFAVTYVKIVIFILGYSVTKFVAISVE